MVKGSYICGVFEKAVSNLRVGKTTSLTNNRE
jgi:hypothetical protein